MNDPAPRARRSREELEALAKDFAATPGAARGVPWGALGALAVTLVLAGIWVMWPEEEASRERAAPMAAPQVTQWQQKLAAERERAKRMQGSSDYFARTAAAESAMLKDLTASAQRIADAAEHRPQAAAPTAAESAASVPLPAPQHRAATTPAAPQKPGTGSPPAASASGEASRRAATSPAAAEPARTPPAEVASAAPPTAAPEPEQKAQCSIYVSELSSSGKLTYADISRMKGGHVDAKTGHAFTPPIALQGRTVVFDVAPNGCVTLARSGR